jgi:hypothetical protein
MIKIEIEVKMKIRVHAITIIALEGVHEGRLIVSYQTLPVSAKYDDADAVMITNSGINKKLGFSRFKCPSLNFIISALK